MNTWANTVLTDQGRALMAKLTQGNTLDLTRAVTGAGFVTPGLLAKQTDVTDQKQTLEFEPVTYPETGSCALPVILRNDGLATGYEATQVGVFATDPDDGEILFFISQAADESSGTIVPSETEMPGYSAEWTFYLKYGQADGVNVTVNPSNAVTREEMEEYVSENAFSQEVLDATFVPISDEEVDAIMGASGEVSTGGLITKIDFSNFENGTFTTTEDGEVITHPVTFDDSGRPITIDGVTIKWP